MATFPKTVRLFRTTGAKFFDYTAAASEPTPNDVWIGVVAAVPPSTGDYFAIGSAFQILSVTITMTLAFNGVSGFIWQYWDGSAWSPLSDVVDGTAGFTALGAQVVSWTRPNDWVQNEIDGVTAYHVRALWSPWTSTAIAPAAGMVTMVDLAPYGLNPLDLDLRWYQLIRPPLANDAETNAWRAVYTAAGQEVLDSSWNVRWYCKSVSTALGVHLDALASDYLLRPDGWSDDRYRSAVVAIDGVAGAYRTPDRTAALAEGLVQAGQAWEMMQAAPATYVVVFYGISDDEALTYRSVMEWGRPKGIGFFMVYANGAKVDTFVLDVSLLDGPDLLAEII